MKTLKMLGAILAGALLFAATYLGVNFVTGRAPGNSTAADASGDAGGNAAAAAPADVRIRAAESQVRLRPQKPEGYNLLASAYLQKERETGDFVYNERAQAALAESFRVAPDNYDAIKLHTRLLLTHHRFADALAEARRAQALRPDDHDTYGAVTDACVELGDYDCAVGAAQRMVDLRPDASSYARVSYLRALHGDNAGAAEAMSVAVRASDPRDPEASAWARTHLGDELLKLGRTAEAEREYDRALLIFPGHQLALAAKARARASAGDFETAVELYNQLHSHDRHLALGDIYTKLGRAEEARREYEAFERGERAAAPEENDYSHLARFWADRGTNLDEALEMAHAARAERADIFTEDVLAWCLYKKGRLEEARASIERALRLGTRDARMLYHAGTIYRALGDRRKGERYLADALALDPSFGSLAADGARASLERPGGAE